MTRNPNDPKELKEIDVLTEEFDDEEMEDVVMFRVRTGLKGGPADADC
jgi:hypothetical protein